MRKFVINANPNHLKNLSDISDEYSINLYLAENGVSESKFYTNDEINEINQTIKENNLQITMVHGEIPTSVEDYYKINKPYFQILQNLGEVGLTLHCKAKTLSEFDKMILQVVHIAEELPNITFYIENESCTKITNLLETFKMVKQLQDLGIKAKALLDTCHLEMDRYAKEIPLSNKSIFTMFQDIIGAIHMSCSHDKDGFIKELHGKPFNEEDIADVAFMESLADDLAYLPDDVLLIAEVLESDYGKDCVRENGRTFLHHIKLLLAEKNLPFC